MKKLLSILLALCLCAALMVPAMAEAEGVYVLMNIPYADFYRAEFGKDAASVDAVTSATKNKPRTGTLAGGSYRYHSDGGRQEPDAHPSISRFLQHRRGGDHELYGAGDQHGFPLRRV